MSMKWRKRHGRWQLWLQGRRRRCLADIHHDRYGWTVVMRDGDLAGPYGDFDLARQSVEKRLWRTTQTQA
jgi:hypothetical protein